MIYAIAAIDSKKGIADETGIPWNLPTDKAYFRAKTEGLPILMGYGFYKELEVPLPNRRNIVIIHPGTKLKAGFEAVEDAAKFLEPYIDSPDVVWIVGGAKVYERLLDYTQKIYLTRVDADYNCTKFFPDFETQFKRVEQGSKQAENNLDFWFEVWQRLPA